MRRSPRFWNRLAAVSLLLLAVLGVAYWQESKAYGTGSGTVSPVSGPSGALKVVSVSPPASSSTAPPKGPFKISFNQAVEPGALSQLKTSVAGSWRSVSPNVVEFVPDNTLLPGTSVTIKSTAVGSQGIVANDGDVLAHAIDISWTTEAGSVLRIQQLLAILGYLPLKWSPTQAASGTSPTQQLYSPVSGSFSWGYPNIPASIKASFTPGVFGKMTQGALVSFERVHGMPVYTSIRTLIWPALLNAEAANMPNPNGYTYAVVSEVAPETITIYHDANVVLHSLVNTGVSQTPTPTGIFFVYMRYPTQTMRGKNINGSYYIDHGVKWVNYIQGSVAIHGFVRSSYGFPQSLGCVELPIQKAAIAWKWIHYGSLVSIS